MPSTRKPPATLSVVRKRPAQSREQPQTRELQSAEKEPELGAFYLPTPASVLLSLPGHLLCVPTRGDSNTTEPERGRRFRSLWPEAVPVSLKSQGVGGAL